MNILSQISEYLFWFIAGILFFRWHPLLSYFLIPISFVAMFDAKKSERSAFFLFSIMAYTVVSPALFEKSAEWFISLRIAIFLFAGALIFRNRIRSKITNVFILLYIYLGYMGIVSLWGWMPIISVLKIIMFGVFILAFVQLARLAESGQVDISKVRSFFLAVSVFFIIGSLLSVPFPSISKSMLLSRSHFEGDLITVKAVDGYFNGVAWHSQTFGPILALLNALIFADYLFNIQRNTIKWLYKVLLVSLPILVYLTSSRTAFGAYFFSLVIVCFFFLRDKQVSITRKGGVKFLGIMLILGAILSVGLSADVRVAVEAFIRKTGSTENIEQRGSLTEDMTSSRMGLVEKALHNFKQSPVFGNGFQVSQEMENMQLDDWQQLLTAPIEKGLIWVAVLEEGGIIGAILFLIFIIGVGQYMLRERCYCFLSCFLTLLVLNTGEAVFFSPSGAGGIAWGITLFGLIIDMEIRKAKLLFLRGYRS